MLSKQNYQKTVYSFHHNCVTYAQKNNEKSLGKALSGNIFYSSSKSAYQ